MNKKMAVPRSQAVGPNSTRTNTRHEQETDVLLIGGGIMSATLGTWLQELEPDWSITMVEQMSSVAEESSNGWNNAGTGHAALMELNYTPQTANGINIDKAVDINEAFHISRQFWAHQVTRGVLNKPKSFINSVPHMSFVWAKITSTSCVRATRRCSKVNCSAVFAILKTISRSKPGRRW